jgi:uncharacterized membrane protein YqiK
VASLFWWFLVVIALLIIAGLILWFLLFYKRMYEVIKVGHSAAIIGKDKARRKKAYTFTIKGGYLGTVSYKVGENGMWKALHPDANGMYTIPKGEVVDKVTIEQR